MTLKRGGKELIRYLNQSTKQKDYWAWYCSRFLPGSIGDANILFHSLHHELINPEAQLRHHSANQSEPDSSLRAKQLRIQWWKESVNSLYPIVKKVKGGEPLEPHAIPAHPILESLFTLLMQDVTLSRTMFASLFRAHTDPSLPYTTEDLERYGKDTIGSIFGLTLDCYWHQFPDIPPAQRLEMEHCLMHLGNAISISQLLRATPAQLSRKTCFLPIQLLANHKVSAEDLYRGEASSESFTEVIFEVASAAHLQLEQCEKLKSSVTAAAKPLLLPSIIVGDYLAKLQKNHFDIYAPGVRNIRPFRWQSKVAWHHWTNKE